MPDEEEFILGERDGWGQYIPLGISGADLRQHLYVIGKSGVENDRTDVTSPK